MTTMLIEQPNNGRKMIYPTTEKIVAGMREQDDARKRNKILKKMTEPCREKMQFIENWFRKEVSHSFRSRYQLGLQVLELDEDGRKNGGKRYGKNAIGRICKILDWEDGIIRMSLWFVQTFTPADLDHLCAIVLPNGAPLTWSHVRVLKTVDDAAKRQELLDRTVKEGWTCLDLAREVKNLKHGSAEEKRGRPPRVPKHFDDVVARQRQSAEEWERLQEKIWNFSAHSLATHAANLPQDQVTEERLRQASELAVHLRQVAKQADEQANKAEKVVQDFKRILRERQQDATSAQPVTTARSMTE